jgi:hypothetical protein
MNITRYTLLVILSICTCHLSAQVTPKEVTTRQNNKAQNRILASFGPQYYFNQYNHEEPSRPTNITNPIQAKNTVGTYLRLGYERTTRYGLTFGVGAVGGSYKYDITIYRDFSTFDPRAARVLKGFIYDSTFSGGNWYIAPEVTVGYRYHLNKKWTLTGKVGAFRKYKLTQYGTLPPTGVVLKLVYPLDDNSLIQGITPSMRYNVFERINGVNVVHAYIGAEHTTKYKYLHHLTFGIDFTQNTARPLYAFTNNWETYAAWKQEETISHIYNGRDFTIALCLGVSLWP